jgi:hypothetical protein
VSDTPSSENLLRSIAITLGKGLLYGLAFCAVYAFVYTPLFYSMQRGERYAGDEEHSKRQMREWDEQSRRSGEMLHDSELMQTRYEALLSKQEQLAQRMDAVLDVWERQARIKK